MLLHILYWIALVLAAAPLAYYVLSLYCVLGYFRGLRRSPFLKSSYSPPVSILKPVRGADCEAYENFASYCLLDYPTYDLIFPVADSSHPTVPQTAKLQTHFP